MLVLPFPQPAKTEPARGTFAVVYSPNGLRQRPTSFVQRPAHPPRRAVFDPSPYTLAWGDAPLNTPSSANAAAPSPGDVLSQFQTYLPTLTQAAGQIIESTDPRVQVKLYEQKIANYEKMKRTPPYSIVPGTLWYDNEIAKMRAKLAAARQNLALTREGEDATRQWRSLGQTALGVGIVAGIAIVTLITVSTARIAQGR